MRWLSLGFVVLAAGCSSHSAWQLSAGQPPPVNSTVQVHGGAGLATAFSLTILAAGAYEFSRSGLSSNAVPEMAPDRKVSEQDCSKPLDYTLGNIRCN